MVPNHQPVVGITIYSTYIPYIIVELPIKNGDYSTYIPYIIVKLQKNNGKYL